MVMLGPQNASPHAVISMDKPNQLPSEVPTHIDLLTDIELLGMLMAARHRVLFWDGPAEAIVVACERELDKRSRPATLRSNRLAKNF